MQNIHNIKQTDQYKYWNNTKVFAWLKYDTEMNYKFSFITNYLFDNLDLNKNNKILDIGCGSGFTTSICANKVGNKGLVVGADISKPLLKLLNQKYKKIKNIKLIHTDIESYKFDEGYFDNVVSRFGIMFFDNPITAFINIYKCLKVGGKLTFVCWNNFKSNEFFSIPANVVSKFIKVKIPLINNSPGPFSFNKKKYIYQLLENSNFKNIKIKNVKTYLKTANILTDTDIMLNIGTGARMLGEKNTSKLIKKMIKEKLTFYLENNIFNKSYLYKANFFLVNATKE